ncbi:MAG: hypothetical protein U0R44_02985 [Candidatus Micrarchaeia archaeon]
MNLRQDVGPEGSGMTVSRRSPSIRKGAMVLSAVGVLGCAPAESYWYRPVAEPISRLSPRKDDTITVGVEYSDSVPKRINVNIIEMHSPASRFCWLFYSHGSDGEYLLNPRSAEAGQSPFIGKIVRVPGSPAGQESVVGVSEIGHGRYRLAGGGAGILFRIRENSRQPVVDDSFSGRVREFCRITDEPKAMLYFDKELDVVVVPLR